MASETTTDVIWLSWDVGTFANAALVHRDRPFMFVDQMDLRPEIAVRVISI